MAVTMYAVFKDVDQAEHAVRELVSRGVEQPLVTVCSSEPFLDRSLPIPAKEEKTRIPFFALLGGGVGATVGVLLSVATYKWMNLHTGGMPIIPYGPTGIVVFEITAMGAIFGTLITLLLEAGLGWNSYRAKASEAEFAEAVADGGVLVCVRCQGDTQATSASDLMKEMGAEKAKTP